EEPRVGEPTRLCQEPGRAAPAGIGEAAGLARVVARRGGLRVTWLGSDLPLDAWDAAVQTHRPDAVVLAAPMAEDVRGLDETVRVVTERRPGVVVAVGGAHQDATAST